MARGWHGISMAHYTLKRINYVEGLYFTKVTENIMYDNFPDLVKKVNDWSQTYLSCDTEFEDSSGDYSATFCLVGWRESTAEEIDEWWEAKNLVDAAEKEQSKKQLRALLEAHPELRNEV